MPSEQRHWHDRNSMEGNAMDNGPDGFGNMCGY